MGFFDSMNYAGQRFTNSSLPEGYMRWDLKKILSYDRLRNFDIFCISAIQELQVFAKTGLFDTAVKAAVTGS
jgi:hypothetical protein